MLNDWIQRMMPNLHLRERQRKTNKDGKKLERESERHGRKERQSEAKYQISIIYRACVFSISLQTDYWHRAENDERHNRALGALPAPRCNSQTQYRPINDIPRIIVGDGITCTSPPTLCAPVLSPCICRGSYKEKLILPHRRRNTARQGAGHVSNSKLFAQWDSAGKVRQWTKSKDQAKQLLGQKCRQDMLTVIYKRHILPAITFIRVVELYLEAKHIGFTDAVYQIVGPQNWVILPARNYLQLFTKWC